MRADAALVDAQSAKEEADDLAARAAALDADDALAGGIADPAFAEIDALFATARDAAAKVPGALAARDEAAKTSSDLAIARADYDAALAAQKPANAPAPAAADTAGDASHADLAQTGDGKAQGAFALALLAGGSIAAAAASRRKIATRRH